MKYLLFSLCFIFLVSCYFDKENEIYPVDLSECDTTSVSYNNDIKPVVVKHCLVCHSNTAAPGMGDGIKLENWNDIKTYALSGSLYGSVSSDPDYFVMPRDYRIPACNVLKIKAWANNGAPDN